MDRYKVLKTIGDGTYGSVSKAAHKTTGEVVAIKQMKRKPQIMRLTNNKTNK